MGLSWESIISFITQREWNISSISPAASLICKAALWSVRCYNYLFKSFFCVVVVSNMEPESTCHKAQFFSWHFSDLRRRLCGGMCWWDFGIASVFSLIMWDSTFKSDQISIFVGHFSIRGNFILFCENPQKRFPILRHVHLHSRRNSSWHNLKDKVSWRLIVHSSLLPCL